MFDLSTLPRECGQLILVTDKVQSPAEFILHRIIASHLRDPGTRVVIASCLEGLGHWKATSAKTSPGLKLTSRIAAGSVVFLDELDRLTRPERLDSGTQSLKILYDKLDEVMQRDDNSLSESVGLLVLDGISSLEWMGTSVAHLKSFVRAVFSLCAKRRYAMVIRYQKVGEDCTDSLLRICIQLSAIHLEVLPLSTGRSGAVSGEINILRGASIVEEDSWEALRRTLVIQYQLLDNGPLFFERGTSAGVL